MTLDVENKQTEATVCVVSVTYGNRWGYLSEVLNAISRQTYKVKSVVVVDNGTGYLTKEILTKFNIDIDIVKLENNRGSAEGFKLGIQSALACNADLLWILDDDNKPALTALEEAVKLYNNVGGIIVSTRIIPGVGRRVSARTSRNGFLGFNIVDSFKKSRLITNSLMNTSASKKQANGDDESAEIVHIAPYGGLLIPTRVVECIGFPREDFVTYADDTEWTSRIEALGGVIRRSKYSLITDLDCSWSIRVSKLNPLISPSTSLYRVYYGVRNQACIEFIAANNKLLFFFNVGIRISVLVVNLIIFSSDRTRSLKRLYVLLKAISDGIRCRLGRRSEYESAR